MTTTTTTLIDLMLRFSPDEARALFESQSRKLLGMSGAEFIRRRDSGELHPADDDERARIAYLTALSAAGTCVDAAIATDDADDTREYGPIPEDGFPIVDLSPEESRAMFDAETRRLLGITGDEFLRRWDSGEYDELFDTPENHAITHLGMISAFGR